MVAVCDQVQERAHALGEAYKVKNVYTDFHQALSESGADAAYIATPIWFHVPMAVQAMEAGKHVLVEKPLGLNYSDCLPALEKAEETGLLAGCAYFRRFYPRYSMAADMLTRGEFGQVVLVRLTYFSWFAPDTDDPKHWRVVCQHSAGGPLADMASHMFDVLIGLLGMPRTVFARNANLVHAWDVEDSSAMVMTLESGALVTASFSWNSKTWSHEFEIVGTEAKVKWHPCDGPKVLKTVGRQVDDLDMPNAENVHLPLIEDFVAASREGRQPRVSLAEAAKTNRLLDAVYESARCGKEVQIG
jgi:predicted dehydrogenase